MTAVACAAAAVMAEIDGGTGACPTGGGSAPPNIDPEEAGTVVVGDGDRGSGVSALAASLRSAVF